jgi:transketolase
MAPRHPLHGKWLLRTGRHQQPSYFRGQNIKDLPSESGDRYNDALKAEKGAYIVADCKGEPDVILLASGSEVASLVEVQPCLKKTISTSE